MRNIKLVVEYFGPSFSGWQIQKGVPTVQGALVEAVFRVTGQKVGIIGAGRTDAGVHALGQVANFHIEHPLPPERYRDALNSYLPDDIRVQSSEEVPEDFHARFSATHRRYRYLLTEERTALYRHYRWEGVSPLDVDTLHKAAGLLLGEHDFSAFCVTASRQENNRCRIEHSRWCRFGPLWVYEIRGNRFLHSMVRSLVGGMVNLASASKDRNPNNLTLESFENMLARPAEQR
ncbi:MAG: tRNA pseudouridine(38-40) synthase TruA, partial [Candidatus Zixiibacteriota bacterium]